MNMKFIVYSKEGCPHCDKIKQVLELSNLEFKEYKLHVDFDRNQFYNEFGEGSTFPQVVLDNKVLGGCTDTIKYLQEQNKIK